MGGRPPSDADRRIAARLEAARRAAGLTKGRCGAHLGISAEQFRKFATGRNRIAAGYLQEMADLLAVPVASFFDPPADAGAAAEVQP